MARVPPTSVEVLVNDDWVPGVQRTCDQLAGDRSCSNVVSYGNPEAVTTCRFTPDQLRTPSGESGCPAALGTLEVCASQGQRGLVTPRVADTVDL